MPKTKKTPEEIQELDIKNRIKKYVKLMIEAANGDGDTEDHHINADSVLCKLLIELGYEEVVDEYRKIDKWYA